MKLEAHHEAWLSAHPSRLMRWLKERLSDGFDVHHMDGNHSNNDPANLVLMESHDHIRLHGGGVLRVLKDGRRARTIARGKPAYEMRAAGLPWPDIADAVGMERWQAPNCRYRAKAYADLIGLPWPIGP